MKIQIQISNFSKKIITLRRVLLIMKLNEVIIRIIITIIIYIIIIKKVLLKV